MDRLGAFAFLLGVVVYKLVIARCIRGKSAMAVLLATFGLSMLLKNFCLNRFTPNFRLLSGTVLDGKEARDRRGHLLGAAGGDQLVLGRGGGRALPVHQADPHRLVDPGDRDGQGGRRAGGDRHRPGLPAGLRHRGGVPGDRRGLLPSYLATHPDVGTLFGLLSFVIVALGGFGSIPGTFAAALLVGLVEALVGFYVAPVFKYVAVFSLYVVVIMVRPKGLFGW